MRKPPAHRIRRRPPFFRPVHLRHRCDGWSEERQCAFLTALYLTGSVTAAARSVRMAPASAYRLRTCQGAASFAAAWDHVLSPPGSGRWKQPREDFRKVTDLQLRRRLDSGFVQPVIYRGEMRAIRKKPDDSALFRLLRRAGDFDDPYWQIGKT